MINGFAGNVHDYEGHTVTPDTTLNTINHQPSKKWGLSPHNTRFFPKNKQMIARPTTLHACHIHNKLLSCFHFESN